MNNKTLNENYDREYVIAQLIDVLNQIKEKAEIEQIENEWSEAA